MSTLMPFVLLCGLYFITGSVGFSLGGSFQALYSETDVAITRLNNSDFNSVVLNSDRAWLVEFYSSWCGHCIHFAPIYKTFSEEIFGWRNLIGVGAIDCAMDHNMPICRDYDIMGYPSMKLFPPQAVQGNLGFEIHGDKTVESIKASVVNYVKEVVNNGTWAKYTGKWPDFRPFQEAKSASLSSLWDGDFKDSPVAIVIAGSKDDATIDEVLLDFSQVVYHLEKPLILKRVSHEEAPSSIMSELGLTPEANFPKLLVVSQGSLKVRDITPQAQGAMLKALKDFVWSEIKTLIPSDLQGKFFLTKDEARIEAKKALAEANEEEKQKIIGRKKPVMHSEAEVKRRRYTVFMSDLENAILYALGHEIAQHAIITGEALNALQDFVDVLVRFFPGRSRTMKFLEAMRMWIMNHDDAIKGDDLTPQLVRLKVQFSSFDDLSNLDWIGCRGSEAKFGGYPCSLWALWHTLTVNHALKSKGTQDNDPSVVLNAMVGYIEHFFGCRECSRHFLQEADNGLAFGKAVKNANDSVLWLWKTHNRVNQRLSGDITDDSAFPKEKFPNKEHCSDCYDPQVAGYDLWSEFKLPQVTNFLKAMYGPSGLSLKGLKNLDELDKKRVRNPPHHDLALFGQASDRIRDQGLDKKNFTKANNEMKFFNSIDISLFLVIYLISAAILYVVYVKFVKKRGISSHLSSLCPRTRPSSNPMVGKV